MKNEIKIDLAMADDFAKAMKQAGSTFTFPPIKPFAKTKWTWPSKEQEKPLPENYFVIEIREIAPQPDGIYDFMLIALPMAFFVSKETIEILGKFNAVQHNNEDSSYSYVYRYILDNRCIIKAESNCYKIYIPIEVLR